RLALFSIMMLALVAPTLPAAAGPSAAGAAPNTLERSLEPVVLQGVQSGRPVDQIFVYRYSGGAWEQIPSQVDERDTGGNYVPEEDGIMDVNDELVFMSGDVGDLTTDPIGDALPITGLWDVVEITDPLNPGDQGWVYVVHSTTLSNTNPADYVNYDTDTQRVTSDDYSLGWAVTGHNGLDYMSLFGGDDVLDRTKVRISYRFIFLFELTEDDFPLDSLVLIKDGPVRALLKRGATVTEAYRAFVRTAFPIDLSTVPGTLEEVRISTDLAAGVTGTYYDENHPEGVTVDGVPDDVLPTPFDQAWRQVTVGEGSNIQVGQLGQIGGDQMHYYKDSLLLDPEDTGDLRSYGDSGFDILNPATEVFTLTTGQFFVPASMGNQGATYYQYFQNPLQVAVTPVYQYRSFLPALMAQD
ncbi:MAG: hypothetical protein ACK2U9_03985, partial [Anaerolineae bacterium]